MLRIKPSKTALLGFALFGFVLLIGCVVAYINSNASLQAIQAKVKSSQEALNNSQKTARRLEAVEQEYTDDQLKLNVLEKGVSTKAYVPTLLRQLEELGKASNLKVAGVRPKIVEAPPPPPPPPPAGSDQDKKTKVVVPPPDPYDKLDLDIEVSGKYWDAVRFLSKITSFPKIIAINNVQVSPAGDHRKLGSPVLSIRINATAFILKNTGDDVKALQMTDIGPSGARI